MRIRADIVTIVLLLCGISVRLINAQETRDTASPRSDALGDPLPADALLRMGTLRFMSPSSIMEMALTKDQRTLITFGEWLSAWDTATGKELWRVPAGEIGVRLPTSYGVRALAMLPSGEHFITVGGNGALVWEARTGERETLELEEPVRHPRPSPFGGVYSVDVTPDSSFAIGNGAGLSVFSPNGKRLFSVNVPLGQQVKFKNRDRLTFGGPYCYAVFSPDGDTLAMVDAARPKDVRFLDAETGDELRTVKCTDRVVRMAFSPTGERFVATERDTAARLYEVDSTELLWTFQPEVNKQIENYTSAIEFSPNGEWLAVAERNQQLYLLDTETGEEVARSKDHSWNPWALAFTQDSSLLYSSGWGGTVHRWRIPEMTQLPVPNGVRANSVVAASPRGDTCAYADQAGNIHLVEADDGTEIRVLNLPGAGYEYLEYSPDGKLLAAGGTCDKQVHVAVWATDDGKLLHRWDWETGRDPLTSIEELRFSPDSKHLAAAAFRQSAAHLWNLETGRLVGRLEHGSVYGLAFSADGVTLLTAGWDSKLRSWATSNGELLETFDVPAEQRDHAPRMYTVCTEPSGDMLATAHLSETVLLWDAKSMAVRGRLAMRGRFTFGSLRFSPDGLWLAAGSSGGRVEVVDPWTGEKVHEVTGHDDGVYMVGFGKDNRSLYSGGAGVCYRWNLRPAEPQLDDDLDRMWSELAGVDSVTAYRAWWGLVDQGSDAVKLVKAKLLATERVIDPIALALGEEESVRSRRLRLLNKTVDSQDGVERLVTIRRAVSVLSHVDTPQAIEALQQIASHSQMDVARLAAQEVRRRQRAESSSSPE